MSSRFLACLNKKLVHPPKFITDSNCLVYEAIVGSHAYGCKTDASDEDIYGIVVPPRAYCLPWTAGIISGFGHNPYQFDQYHQPHIREESSGKEWDFTLYNIIRYFHLCFGNNPNMLDSLFVPEHCITHITKIGLIIRDSRKLFLSKLCVPTFRGYSISQMKKMESKQAEGKRVKLIEKYGFDTKFAMNLVRLMFQVEQILLEGDMDLQRNSQTLIAIRNGQWSIEKVKDVFYAKDSEIEGLVLKSSLRAKPDETKIKDILMECLEVHYGKVADRIIIEDTATQSLKQIIEIAQRGLAV